MTALLGNTHPYWTVQGRTVQRNTQTHMQATCTSTFFLSKKQAKLAVTGVA